MRNFSISLTVEENLKKSKLDRIKKICGLIADVEDIRPILNKFSFKLFLYYIGVVRIVFAECSPISLARHEDTGGIQAGGGIFILQVRLGEVGICQEGRWRLLREGDFCLLDGARYWKAVSRKPAEILGIGIPRRWLARWTPRTADIRGPTPCEGPWRATLAATLAALSPESLTASAPGEDVLCQHLAILVALAVGTDAGMRSYRHDVLTRIRRVMRARLHEPELDPAKVAAQFRISKRNLHAIFRAGGSTFGADLMAMRLESAGEHLRNRRFSGMSISEIAFLNGFSSASHFSRRFRQAYGMSPRAYRVAG